MTIASQLAPTGTLRVGVWMVPYFARTEGAALRGLVPELAAALAADAGVGLALSPFANPAQILAAFADGALDATFLGITADRAAAIDFGPVVFALQTTYLVPAQSRIADLAEIDRPGIRVAVPANSAQEAHLRRTMVAATLVSVPAETPQRALDLLQSGDAHAFSHVAPMLAAVQGALPGARILPGSYFDVPVAVGVARNRGGAVAAAGRFVEAAKRFGLVQQAIDRAAITGVVVGR